MYRITTKGAITIIEVYQKLIKILNKIIYTWSILKHCFGRKVSAKLTNVAKKWVFGQKLPWINFD